MSHDDLSRRQFLEAAAATPFALRRRRVPANDKVVLGLIGCGGQGPYNMRKLLSKPEVEFAALCDVDETHLPQSVHDVQKLRGKTPATYKDFRRILDRKDIDGVVIGTPDHWHALPLIMSCEAGKDAFCEKPISHDINEARAMAAAVRRFNRIVQVGTWQRSTPEFVSAVDFVRSGKLGRVVYVRAWRTDTRLAGHGTVSTPPEGLDYDFWIGPAKMAPYEFNHVHYRWRWFFNTGTGMAGDWGVHMMDIGLLGMSRDTDLVMPVEVSTFGGRLAYPTDDRQWPDTVHSIMRFKNPDFVMQWETGREQVGRPDHGTEFVAADGKNLMVWRGGWIVRDADGKELPRYEAPPTSDHWQNWLDCMKTRQQPRSHLTSMAQTTAVCHLVNASYLSGDTVRWDKSSFDIAGGAGKHTISYFREYRKPWKLPIYSA
ncbi:MAG TPA: Gfo/Idh/MocA family oxidoreductase [Chthonomonadales bacterium]|nr:Gfo/Idh/MocA family oxidoreductase [Chthonomonadales bacterium]